MEDQKIISGITEQAIWTVIEADLAAEEELLNYDVLIEHNGKQIELYIDIDLGGGFEGGSEVTQLTAPLNITPQFKFAVHDEGFLDSLGKFFGLDSVKTGYPEFDQHVIIKTNHESKARDVFADAAVRDMFLQLTDFDFGIHTHTLKDSDIEQPFLELNINEGITDPATLRQLYHAFYTILVELDN